MRGPNAFGDHAAGGNREFVWSANGTLELQHVWHEDGCVGSSAVLARDELIFTWMLRRGRGMLSRVFVTDVVEMWEKMTVVRIKPFLGGAVAGLHYLVLLIIRVRAAVWDAGTVAMDIHDICDGDVLCNRVLLHLLLPQHAGRNAQAVRPGCETNI